MATGKHTPLPWVADTYGDIRQHDTGSSIPLVSAFVEDAFSSGSPGRKQALSNAAFIVRACNSHYELLAALKDLSDIIGTIKTTDFSKRISQRYDSALAVIARAEAPDA